MMTDKPHKTYALIYPRVSSERQVVEGHGLDSQTKRNVDYAENMHYLVFNVYAEEGVSGGLFDRPKMKQLLNDIEMLKSREPDCEVVVIFDDIKRLARDLEIHFALKKEIYGRGGRVESPNFRFEDTPTGKFTEQVMAAAAELERNQNKLQVSQKMKARLERGYWTFCPPPGLVNIKDKIHGKILVSQEPIASIFKAAIEGFCDRRLITQQDVVDFIYDQYHIQKINRQISIHGVQELLTEPLYAGIIQYKKWGVSRRKGHFNGIITETCFDEVQRILADRTRPKARRDSNPDFPLRGLVLCSVCHKPLTASWNKSRNGTKYPNYFCKTKGCLRRYKVSRKPKLENDFLALIQHSPKKPFISELANTVLADVWKQYKDIYIGEQQSHQKRLQELSAAITNLTSRVAKTNDDVLIASYEQEISKLAGERKQYESVSYPPRYTSEQFGTATRKVMEVLENPVGMWQSGNLDDQLTVYFMHFDQKPTYDKELGFGTAQLGQSVSLFRSLGSDKNHSVEMPGSEPGSEAIHLKHLQA